MSLTDCVSQKKLYIIFSGKERNIVIVLFILIQFYLQKLNTVFNQVVSFNKYLSITYKMSSNMKSMICLGMS